MTRSVEGTRCCCSRWCGTTQHQEANDEPPWSCTKKVAAVIACIIGQYGYVVGLYIFVGKNPLSCAVQPIAIAPHCYWPQYFPAWVNTQTPENEGETPDDPGVSNVYPEVPPVDTRLFGSNQE